MNKTITVKGVGHVAVSPDCAVIRMDIDTTHTDYAAAMTMAAEKIATINAALQAIGFEEDAVKTADFDVHTDYDRVKDRNGNYQRVFAGYVCRQRLKLTFDFDTRLLAQTLQAIASCDASPEIAITFTVKDPSAVNAALLRAAAENAREKAAILCDAAGVTLGELINIDYNWGELNVISRTQYALEDKCAIESCNAIADIEITPEDIAVTDTAAFVWAIC